MMRKRIPFCTEHLFTTKPDPKRLVSTAASTREKSGLYIQVNLRKSIAGFAVLIKSLLSVKNLTGAQRRPVLGAVTTNREMLLWLEEANISESFAPISL